MWEWEANIHDNRNSLTRWNENKKKQREKTAAKAVKERKNGNTSETRANGALAQRQMKSPVLQMAVQK